jgi:hypothetical protein
MWEGYSKISRCNHKFVCVCVCVCKQRLKGQNVCTCQKHRSHCDSTCVVFQCVLLLTTYGGSSLRLGCITDPPLTSVVSNRTNDSMAVFVPRTDTHVDHSSALMSTVALFHALISFAFSVAKLKSY